MSKFRPLSEAITESFKTEEEIVESVGLLAEEQLDDTEAIDFLKEIEGLDDELKQKVTEATCNMTDEEKLDYIKKVKEGLLDDEMK
jgi:hypothetical protein